jgi:hypothetical protein
MNSGQKANRDDKLERLTEAILSLVAAQQQNQNATNSQSQVINVHWDNNKIAEILVQNLMNQANNA